MVNRSTRAVQSSDPIRSKPGWTRPGRQVMIDRSIPIDEGMKVRSIVQEVPPIKYA
jgi:hypothetical protein